MSHALNTLPNYGIWNLSRNESHCTDHNQKNTRSKGHRMEKELIQDHMSNHDDGELDEEDDAHESGVLLALLESEETVHERRSEEVH